MRLILPLLACLLLAGCWPDDQPAQPPAPKPEAPRAVMPEGLKGDETVRFKYRRDAGLSTSHETVAGRGASIDARGNDTAANHDASAPTAQLSSGVGGSSGGSLRAQLSAITPETLMSNPFAWGGLIGLAFAAFLASRGLMKQAMWVAIASGTAIVAAIYPWAILAGVAIVAWQVYRNAKGHEVARTTLAAAEKLPPEQRLAMKLATAKVQNEEGKPGEQHWLRAIKKADGLPSEREDRL